MRHLRFGLLLVSIILLSACQQATDHDSSDSASGPVQGTINGQSFEAVVAVARESEDSPNAYQILLTGSSSTPFVQFYVASSPQSYAVTTFGANGGLAVTAYIGGLNFVAFDSGTLVIEKVDVGAKQITGTLRAVKTTDGTSSLAGTFTATIQ